MNQIYNYINKIKERIKSYKERSGFLITFSVFLSKISSFVASMIVVRILTQSDYGSVTYARSLLTFFIPFVGLGANLSLLRFGSIEKNNTDKYSLYRYSMKYGFIFSFVLLFILFIFSFLFNFEIENSRSYYFILIFLIVSSCIRLIPSTYLRLIKENKLYAFSLIVFSLINLILFSLFSYLFSGIGYALATVISPIIVSIPIIVYIKRKNENYNKKKIEVKKKEFWSYGIYIGIGSIASQLILSLDVIMIGSLISDPQQVAIYKVATIIPFNLLFIPSSFLTTDFVYIAEKYKEKNYLIRYYLNYLKLFILISSIIAAIMILFSGNILSFLYGNSYEQSYFLSVIITIGIMGSFLLRTPLGNILAAVGKAKWNVINAFVTLGVNAFLNYILINNYGVTGAAFASCISMWFSGFFSLLLFKKYLKLLN